MHVIALRRIVLPIVALALLAGVPGSAGARLAYATFPASGGPRIAIADDDGRRPEQVARGAMPALAPDGTLLAYVRNAYSRNASLEIIDLATRLVVRTGVDCAQPTWSPDGGALLCLTETADRRGRITGGGVLRVDPLTGGAASIVRLRGSVVERISWSPAGDAFAYDAVPLTQRGRSDSRVVVARADGSERRVVARAAQAPVWGPNGVIAVARYRTVRVSIPDAPPMRYLRSQVWTVRADGTGLRQVTRYRARGLTIGPQAVVWAPDGSALYGVIAGEDQSAVVRIGVGNGRVRALGVSDAAPIAISADGRDLLVASGLIGAAQRLRVLPVTGGASRVIVRGAVQASVTPGWRP
jgi:Tol biopolymer transport system component